MLSRQNERNFVKMSNLAYLAHFFMYFKMDIIEEIIRPMTKITKCPIFLDAMGLLVA